MRLEHIVKDDVCLLFIRDTASSIDLNPLPRFKGTVSNMMEQKIVKFTVNFCGNYINSKIIGIIVHALREARKAGGDLYICELTDNQKELFKITKLDTVIKIFETEAEALVAFKDHIPLEEY